MPFGWEWLVAILAFGFGMMGGFFCGMLIAEIQTPFNFGFLGVVALSSLLVVWKSPSIHKWVAAGFLFGAFVNGLKIYG